MDQRGMSLSNQLEINTSLAYHDERDSLIIHTILDNLGLMFEVSSIAEHDPYRVFYARSNMKGDATSRDAVLPKEKRPTQYNGFV